METNANNHKSNHHHHNNNNNNPDEDKDRRRMDGVPGPAQWLAANKRLTNERELAEKSLAKDADLFREWTVLERARQEVIAETVKRVRWFKANAAKISARLHDQSNANPLAGSKESLQQLLETFESKLTAFKLNMRTEFDELQEQESCWSSDLSTVSAQIESFSDQGKQVVDVEAAKRVREQQQRQEHQVRAQEELAQKAVIGEVDRELASLGRYGRWDVRDHDVFLRTWNSFFGNFDVIRTADLVFSVSSVQRRQLLRRLEQDVFAKSMDEIEEHVAWYARTLELHAKKKQLLASWKSQQNSRRQKEILNDERQLKANDLKVVDVEDAESQETNNEEEKRLQAKLRVAKWKADKAKQQQEEEVLQSH
jgi:hypothetical protein